MPILSPLKKPKSFFIYMGNSLNLHWRWQKPMRRKKNRADKSHRRVPLQGENHQQIPGIRLCRLGLQRAFDRSPEKQVLLGIHVGNTILSPNISPFAEKPPLLKNLRRPRKSQRRFTWRLIRTGKVKLLGTYPAIS